MRSKGVAKVIGSGVYIIMGSINFFCEDIIFLLEDISDLILDNSSSV